MSTFPLFLMMAPACSPDARRPGVEVHEKGFGDWISGMFNKMVDHFVDKANTDRPISDWEPRADVPIGEDPTIDALMDSFGLVEVDPGSGKVDGSIAANFIHQEWDEETDEFFEDEVCFLSHPIDFNPEPEELFMAEFYGFRSTSGHVDGDRVIYYVNGIRNTSDLHCTTLEHIADATCGVVVGIFNESESAVKDVWQTIGDRFSGWVADTFADTAIARLTQVHDNPAAKVVQNVIVQKLRLGQPVELWAHSQGGAVTALGIAWALPILNEEGLDATQIKVVTFGSAAPTWPNFLEVWPEGPMYEHYVHINDATPGVLGVGPLGFNAAGYKRSGSGATIHTFDATADTSDNANHETFEWSYNFHEDNYVADLEANYFELKMEEFHDVDVMYLGAYIEQHGQCETIEDMDAPVQAEDPWIFEQWANMPADDVTNIEVDETADGDTADVNAGDTGS